MPLVVLLNINSIRKFTSSKLWISFFMIFLLFGIIADVINFQFFPERNFNTEVFFSSILRLWTYTSTLIFFSYAFSNFSIKTILSCWLTVFLIVSVFEYFYSVDISYDVNPELNFWKYSLYLPLSAYLIWITNTRIFARSGIFGLLLFLSFYFEFASAFAILVCTLIYANLILYPKKFMNLTKIILIFSFTFLSFFLTFRYKEQLRTIEVEISFNKILEDRKESFGGLASFRQNFVGWGLGHTMTDKDINIALQPHSLYSNKSEYKGLIFQNYLNNKIYFHSIFWDFWARYFLAPFLTILLGFRRAIMRRYIFRNFSTLHFFFLIQLFTDLMFSTIGQFNDLLILACLVHLFRTNGNT